jgi:hypothetical protein
VADVGAIFSRRIRHRSEFDDEGRIMTGLGVERMRTAFPRPFQPPAGVSALMPPHSQGAERRTETRTRSTRWGLRVLVVGGLAGAAWLLTGAAAHAADRTDGPTGSLLGSVVGVGDAAPVTGLLTAAVQPLESVSPVHAHHVVASVLEAPRRVLTRPAETLDRASHRHTRTPVDAALGTVDHVLGEVAGPTRLTGGPATTPQSLAPALRAPADAPRATVPPQHDKAVSVPSAHHRHRVAPAAHSPAAAQDENPGGSGPAAPLRPHLGDVSGTPTTSGSGTPTDGGAPAFLPAAIADSTMASHLLPIASDVEVRRHDAEAPTVSPD